MKFILKLFKTFVISLCMLFCLNTVQAAHFMLDDWIKTSDRDALCGGYYQETPLKLPLTEDLKLHADKGLFKPEGVSTLEGHVQLFQNDRQIRAERARIHRDPSRAKPLYCIEAFDTVRITEPGLRIDGTQATLLVEEEEQTVENATYRLYPQHGRGEATRLSIYHRNLMHLDHASYSTCAPCDNSWTLRARSLDLNKETGRGKAYHSTLYVKDLPVFYLPYFNFPIDDRRQTGFLYPSIGSSSRSGFQASAPFYWNLAPHYDATITPHLFSQRGGALQASTRYVQTHSQGELEGFWLPNDPAYARFKNEKRAKHPGMAENDPRLRALERDNHRGALRVKHQASPNPHWQSTLQYHRVHDDNDLVDFSDTLGMSGSQLLQEANLIYQQPSFSLQTRLQQHQTLHAFEAPLNQEVYKRLPQITLRQRSDLPLGMLWDLQGDFTHFAHKPDPLTQTLFSTGDRLDLRPSLSLPLRKPWGSLTPKIQWKALSYHLQPGPNNPSQSRHSHLDVPIFSVDSKLFFERSLRLNKAPYKQSLEPRLYYLRVPFRAQQGLPNFDTGFAGFSSNQLYWDNRFTGLDRIGDSHQITLGLGTGFFPNNSGIEKAYVSLGQIRYFQARKVQSCTGTGPCADTLLNSMNTHHSALVGEARYQILEDLSTRADTEWDSRHSRSDKTGFYLQYNPEPLAVFNMGYQFLRVNPVLDPQSGLAQSLRQSDLSMAWPLNPRWRLLGRWHYDIDRKRSNDISLGIEKQGCCTAVRLLATRFLRPYDLNQPQTRPYTNAIFIQWVFKGLGAFGDNALHTNLKRAIPDYQPWSEKAF